MKKTKKRRKARPCKTCKRPTTYKSGGGNCPRCALYLDPIRL